MIKKKPPKEPKDPFAMDVDAIRGTFLDNVQRNKGVVN
jgi:hypothetical protein